MSGQDNKIKATKEVTYYGKKLYEIHPLLARVKKPEAKLPDYRPDELKDKRGRESF